MTGDQGAVLLCVQRNMNAFVPPRPCPRLCSGCTASDDRRSNAVLLCVQRNMNAFVPPTAPAQDYCFRWQMTGDQGAVLLCVQRNMNAFVPPCPRLLLQMTGDQGAVLLCVQRNMNTFVPPRPCPRLCWGCTASDDRRSRCSAFVCAEEHERFCPPPPLPKTIASDDRRSRCSAFVCVCAQEHERFCPPPPAHPRPCPRLCSGCTVSDDRRSRCSAFCVCRGTWTLLSPPPPLPKTIAWDDRRSRCSAFVCAEEHERCCPPPRPCPRLLLQMTGDQGAVLLCVQRNMNSFVPPPPLPKTMFRVHMGRWQAMKVQCRAQCCRVSYWLVCGSGLCVYGWVRFVCADELYLCAWRS